MIVLDTHVLVWALADAPRLGARARSLIDDAIGGDGILISAITPWEIVMLVEKGRLALGRDAAAWIDAALAIPGLRLAPLTPAISIDSVRLPGSFQADPADRLIIATARDADATLLTADRAILDYAAAGYVKASDAAT